MRIGIVAAIIIVLILGRRLLGRGSRKHHPSRIHNRHLKALRGLTIASLKMYFRNRIAIMFSLFFPIFFIIIFGSVFSNTSASFKIDLTNQSHSQLSTQFINALGKVGSFKISKVSLQTAAADLNKGSADLQVIIPPSFGQSQNGHLRPVPIVSHFNAANPGNGQAANLIMTQLAGDFNISVTHAPQVITVAASGVKTKNLTYIDFLLPGMVGLSIMQLGIFSVAFAFVSFKTTGMLRRVQATPTHPFNFLAAQGLTRLIIAILQTVILVLVGSLLFHFHLAIGSWLPFLALALIGSAVFMGIGFIIAGWAKNEDQAQPVATLIQFPMLFLSGTFFSRSSFPHVLQVITNYLPLTYLADGLRQIANNGASLWGIRGDLLGLAIWGILCYATAVRVFSWE